MKEKVGIIIAGVVVGLVAIWLGLLGNPPNMAVCVACFVRDTAGALGLHRAEVVQYIRPELIGIIIGAFALGLIKKEFMPQGGSAPFTRFVLGVCIMVGALIFLGCPFRLVLRMAGGDLNALIGLIGFAGGILTGVAFLNRGFSLQRGHEQSMAEGLALPAASVLLLILLVAAPAFLFFSASGPGSQHAPLWLSLAGGLIIGLAAQRSRLCFISGIRDAVLFKEFKMLFCFLAILVTVLVGNIINGKFNLGLAGQPIAHTEWVWNILGLYLVGFGSVLLGGCPLRQLILSGSGNSDSGVTVLGFLAGAAISHNFRLASSGDGTTPNGRYAFAVCAIIIFVLAFLNSGKSAKGASA
jgi:YedE family putative selenium metabolism protein